jgi:hypothetical protein
METRSCNWKRAFPTKWKVNEEAKHQSKFFIPSYTPMCRIMDNNAFKKIRKWTGISYQWVCTSSEEGKLLDNLKELNMKDVIN